MANTTRPPGTKDIPPPSNEAFASVGSVLEAWIARLNMDTATPEPPMSGCNYVSARFVEKLDRLLTFVGYISKNCQIIIELKDGKIRFIKVLVSLQA